MKKLTLIERNKAASNKAALEFKPKASIVHNNKYDYSLTNYVNNSTKVKIICREHGEFLQSPDKHLSGRGCPHCADIVRSIALKKKSEERIIQASLEFTTKSNLIHKNKYDYSLVEYQSSQTKIQIICPAHGIFEQAPYAHHRGQGCPHCASETSGFTRTKFKEKCIKNNESLGILYILECFNDNETFIKIRNYQ